MKQEQPHVKPELGLPPHHDALHLRIASWPFYTGHLSASACHLANYLVHRAVKYPSPLWFASRLHLALLASMLPQERSDDALLELIDARLVTLVEPVSSAEKGGGA